MANMNITRRPFTDLSDSQQIRELNRQMEWIWHQLLGGLTEKAFSSAGTVRFVNKVQDQIATNIEADTASFVKLKAALAEFVVAQIAVAQLDFATVADLVASALVLERGVGDSVYVVNLQVTSANMLNAVIGHLVIKGTDGNYYNVVIDSEGQIDTELQEVSAAEIAAGVTNSGKQIVEETINAQTITGQNISANQALFNTVLTGALSAGKITAGEALIASAVIPVLYTTSINAMGRSMDITANSSITLLTGNVNTAQSTANNAQSAASAAQIAATNAQTTADGVRNDFQRIIRIDVEGLHVGDNQTSAEVLIDSESMNILLGGIRYSRFASNYVQFGDYQLRRSADGGLVFKKEGT